MLKEAGFSFIVKAMDTDESYPSTLSTGEVAGYLARKKAEAYRSILKENELVITADTVVILQGQILGKPSDKAEATQMLNRLSGQKHLVTTGVCLTTTNKTITFDDTTIVSFKPLMANEIDFYINKYRPFDKAGAYGIQEWIGMMGIEKIEGSYFNVMGLPIHLLYEKLKAL